MDSKGKGNRVERSLCKMFSDRFGREFTRSVGSGNRWGQVGSMCQSARHVFSGDICVPDGFLWTLECKGGYDSGMDPLPCSTGAVIDGFIEQASADATRSGRRPMVVWKRNRRPWVAILRWRDLPASRPEVMCIYGEWAIVPLEWLLSSTSEHYWFGATNA